VREQFNRFFLCVDRSLLCVNRSLLCENSWKLSKYETLDSSARTHKLAHILRTRCYERHVTSTETYFKKDQRRIHTKIRPIDMQKRSITRKRVLTRTNESLFKCTNSQAHELTSAPTQRSAHILRMRHVKRDVSRNTKETYSRIKELYAHAKETYSHAKETYSHTWRATIQVLEEHGKETYSRRKETYSRRKEAYSRRKENCSHTQQTESHTSTSHD